MTLETCEGRKKAKSILFDTEQITAIKNQPDTTEMQGLGNFIGAELLVLVGNQ